MFYYNTSYVINTKLFQIPSEFHSCPIITIPPLFPSITRLNYYITPNSSLSTQIAPIYPVKIDINIFFTKKVRLTIHRVLYSVNMGGIMSRPDFSSGIDVERVLPMNEKKSKNEEKKAQKVGRNGDKTIEEEMAEELAQFQARKRTEKGKERGNWFENEKNEQIDQHIDPIEPQFSQPQQKTQHHTHSPNADNSNHNNDNSPSSDHYNDHDDDYIDEDDEDDYPDEPRKRSPDYGKYTAAIERRKAWKRRQEHRDIIARIRSLSDDRDAYNDPFAHAVPYTGRDYEDRNPYWPPNEFGLIQPRYCILTNGDKIRFREEWVIYPGNEDEGDKPILDIGGGKHFDLDFDTPLPKFTDELENALENDVLSLLPKVGVDRDVFEREVMTRGRKAGGYGGGDKNADKNDDKNAEIKSVSDLISHMDPDNYKHWLERSLLSQIDQLELDEDKKTDFLEKNIDKINRSSQLLRSSHYKMDHMDQIDDSEEITDDSDSDIEFNLPARVDGLYSSGIKNKHEKELIERLNIKKPTFGGKILYLPTFNGVFVDRDDIRRNPLDYLVEPFPAYFEVKRPLVVVRKEQLEREKKLENNDNSKQDQTPPEIPLYSEYPFNYPRMVDFAHYMRDNRGYTGLVIDYRTVKQAQADFLEKIKNESSANIRFMNAPEVLMFQNTSNYPNYNDRNKLEYTTDRNGDAKKQYNPGSSANYSSKHDDLINNHINNIKNNNYNSYNNYPYNNIVNVSHTTLSNQNNTKNTKKPPTQPFPLSPIHPSDRSISTLKELTDTPAMLHSASKSMERPHTLLTVHGIPATSSTHHAGFVASDNAAKLLRGEGGKRSVVVLEADEDEIAKSLTGRTTLDSEDYVKELAGKACGNEMESYARCIDGGRGEEYEKKCLPQLQLFLQCKNNFRKK